MNLNPVASNVLVLWYLLLSLILTGAVLALAIALFRLNARMESYANRIDPLLEKADAALNLANEKLTTIGSATEGILTHSEAVAATVHARAETTAGLVQKTIHAPFIGVNALLAGLAAGAQTFGVLQSRRRRPAPAPPPSTYSQQEGKDSHHGQ